MFPVGTRCVVWLTLVTLLAFEAGTVSALRGADDFLAAGLFDAFDQPFVGTSSGTDTHGSAEMAGRSGGLLQGLFKDSPGGGWWEQSGLTLWGLLEQGITLNPDDPRDRSNGVFLFNDRANEYQMGLLYLSGSRPVDREHKDWDIGGEVDLLFGTTGRFLKARG